MAYQMADAAQRRTGLVAAAAALRRGELVAVPVDSGYGLVADAFSEPGVSALRAARSRPGLRPQLLVGQLATMSGIARLTPAAERLAADHWPGLLTLLLAAQPSLAWGIAPTGSAIALRMPMHPVALELACAVGPLALVPAAVPGAAALESGDEVRVGLVGVVRMVLDGGHVPRLAESSVVDLTVDPPRLIRAGAVSAAVLRDSWPELIVMESTSSPVAG